MKTNKRENDVEKNETTSGCVDSTSLNDGKSILESISMFESTIQRGKEAVVELCKPSSIGEFQKERLEFICRNKIGDQKKHKEEGTVPDISFKKHEKTGEYQVAIPVSTHASNHTKPSKVAELINSFEEKNDKS